MIYDNDGNLVKSKSEDDEIFNQLRNRSASVKESQTPKVMSGDTLGKSHYLVAKMPINIASQRLGFYVVVKDVTLAFETLDNLINILIYSFVAGLVMSSGIGYFLAGKSLKPIRKAYESKQLFLANASHELKTPLSIIMLSTETLEGEVNENETFQRQIISGIKEETLKMSDLVKNLLFLAKNENQNIVASKSDFNLSALLLKQVEKHRQIAQVENIQFEEKIQSGIHIVGDEKLIASAFGILIDNAIKYTKEEGRVVVSLDSNLVKKRQKITARISDTGIGIPSNELENIFERFYRVDSSRSKETGGHGLGLSIAKEVFDSHDAKITVNSIENVGTSFIIEF
jgi:signal transduction histidine kinase